MTGGGGDSGETTSITGIVWQDTVDELKEDDTYIELYDSGKDMLLSGIKVELMDSSGKTTGKTTTTSSNGMYTLTGVDASKLDSYYVRFSGYDSNLSPVKRNITPNGSKAIKDGSGGASTQGINLTEYLQGNTVENINLGLMGNYTPKSGLIDEQIEYVKIIRGKYSFKYEYGKSAYTDGGALQYQTSSRTFTQKLYPSDIAYHNDSEASNNDLEVYVVYKITIHNPETRSDEFYTEKSLDIEELTNEFKSDRYELSTNTSVADSEVRSDISNWRGGGNTATCTNLSKFKGIGPGETSSATYIQFKLTDYALNQIVHHKVNNLPLDEYSSEAHAYGYHNYIKHELEWIPVEDDGTGNSEAKASTISGDTTPKALIERDTENEKEGEDAEPKGYMKDAWNEYRTEEPDYMDSGALFIKFALSDSRTIKGNIFEDLNTSEREQLHELVGNGQKDSEEKGVSGVTVSLIDANTTDGRVTNLYNGEWHQNGNTWNLDRKSAIVDVNEDGSYTLEGVIPGKYYLQFTYGNGKVKLTDLNGNEIPDLSVETKIDGENIDINNYKSTIVQGATRTAFNNPNDESVQNKWFLDVINEQNSSIAIDDTSNNENGEVNSGENAINTRTKHEYEIKNVEEENSNIKTINAKSPIMEVQFEYRLSNKIDHNQVGNLITDCTGMNFGIIQRPYTDLQLTKQITNLKVTLSNGTTIVNWTPNSSQMQEPYVAALGNEESTKYLDENVKKLADRKNSFMRVEMDELNIYGSTLEVKYEIVVTNLSQVDYAEEDYYKYGEHSGESVTTKASKIIDYLPAGFNSTFATEDSNTSSVELTKTQFEQEKENGYVSQESFDAWKADSYKKYEIQSEKKLKTQIGKTKDEVDSNKKDNCLVYEFTLIKQLTPQEEDMDYNSSTEIAGVKNSSLTKRTKEMYQYTPGNYDGMKETDADERDNDYARVSIIKETGANKSAIMYITLGISMIVLATGIILIKKFVLDKK